MKPLKLQLQAFGPFAGRQVVDFTLLGAKTFFLIHGPTGSGKTSILDGMCFALFGDSSGGEREGRQMRSHHADASTTTEVVFEFALGAARYRVRRVPEHLRKAVRGDALVKQAQQAELWRLGEQGEQPLASGWSKVTDRVEELLGFESRQFRQVIVLPQGRFFDFLKSSSQEREKILQVLFGTELYKRMEEALKRAADEVAGQAKEVRTRRQALLDQAGAVNDEELEARQVRQREALQGCRQDEQAAAEHATAVESRLVLARELAARFAERDAAAVALAQLEQQQGDWQQRRGQLAAARKAAVVRPYERAWLQARAALQAEQQRRAEREAALAAAQQAAALASADLQQQKQRAPELERLLARIAALEALGPKVASLAHCREEHAAARSGHARAEHQASAARQQRALAATELEALQREVQALTAPAAGGEAARLRLQQAQQQERQARELATLLQQLAASARSEQVAQAKLEAARRQCEQAATYRRDTFGRWMAGQSARIAQALVHGQPCPVCGAHEHPSPAHVGVESVTDDFLQGAEQRLEQAEAALRAATAAAAEAAQQRATLQGRVEALRGGEEIAGAAGAATDAEARDAEAALRERQDVEGMAAAPAGLPGAHEAVREGHAVAGAAAAEADARDAQAALPDEQDAARLAAAEADVRAAQQALAQAEQAASRLQLRQAEVPTARQRVQGAESQLEAAQAALLAASSAMQRLGGQLAELEQAIAPELAAPDRLEAALVAARRQRDGLAGALQRAEAAAAEAVQVLARAAALAEEGASACRRCEESCEVQAQAYEQQWRAAGFADARSYELARLDEAAIDGIEVALRRYEEDTAAARERLQRAADATRDMEPPELAAREAEHRAAQDARVAASNAVRDALAALQVTEGFVASLAQFAQSYRQLEERHAVLRSVADLATGNNPHRMSFQRYVLATLLEEVLAATTVRLRVMSRGRYEMRRRLEAGDARAAGGLDLEVFDHYTGTTRAVGTLSGGESFLASLALALGLSDVVQSHAGGIRLDAIFVDEGFGTLDPEALDFAIRTLKDLQQAGRTVGIISHVGELREWIDARLELKAGRRGSEAEFVV